jgi:hypothetical protein
MDFSSATNILFKAVAVLLSVFYLLYSLIIGKQIRIMGKTVDDKANQFLYLISSVQTAAAFILLIFSIFLV